jgi:hypothetical protein
MTIDLLCFVIGLWVSGTWDYFKRRRYIFLTQGVIDAQRARISSLEAVLGGGASIAPSPFCITSAR